MRGGVVACIRAASEIIWDRSSKRCAEPQCLSANMLNRMSHL
jgi:hypothetical protein